MDWENHNIIITKFLSQENIISTSSSNFFLTSFRCQLALLTLLPEIDIIHWMDKVLCPYNCLDLTGLNLVWLSYFVTHQAAKTTIF